MNKLSIKTIVYPKLRKFDAFEKERKKMQRYSPTANFELDQTSMFCFRRQQINSFIDTSFLIL